MEGAILRTLGHLATGVGFRGHHCHQVALTSLPCPPPPVPTPPPLPHSSHKHSLSGMPIPAVLMSWEGCTNHHKWVNYNRNLLPILEARV